MTVKNVKKNLKNIKNGKDIGLYPPDRQPFLLNEYTFFFKFFFWGDGVSTRCAPLNLHLIICTFCNLEVHVPIYKSAWF